MQQRSVGVLTFHRCINYGSYWQARCLVEGLQERGLNAVLIDHMSGRVSRAEWACGLQPTLPTPTREQDYPRYGLKMLKFSRACSSLPRSRPVALEQPSEMESFDAVVVGSDEVWNLKHPWYGGCSLFWGEGVRARQLISYAASFGSYHVSEGLDHGWAERLQAFDAISVRDENSRCLVEGALGREPEVVLDPCLQFPAPTEPRVRAPRARYVAVYGHTFSEGFIREVRRWARSRGCRLVSIGYRNDWADRQWITAGPHEFAQFMARARAVVTNFFHGCVFALRHAKPFVCEMSPYRYVKVRNLIITVGGEKHLAWENTPSKSFDACLDEPVEPAVLERIVACRQRSNAFLDRALA